MKFVHVSYSVSVCVSCVRTLRAHVRWWRPCAARAEGNILVEGVPPVGGPLVRVSPVRVCGSSRFAVASARGGCAPAGPCGAGLYGPSGYAASRSGSGAHRGVRAPGESDEDHGACCLLCRCCAVRRGPCAEVRAVINAVYRVVDSWCLGRIAVRYRPTTAVLSSSSCR